ncbi:MAG: hypothetical protein AAB433_22655 [Nitrospirota bacterium]
MNGLNSLGWQIHDHLKQYRPKMFQALKAEGRLNQYVLDQQTKADASLTFLEQRGLQPHEAMEMLQDQIFPPSEEDVPNLGETMQPYTD